MVTMYAKWVGIDFGQTLMDSSPERTYWMIGDTSKELGEPELVEERCHKWRMMKEKYGSYPVIKEKARPETMSYVFDDRPGVAEIFSRIEQGYLKVADGAIDAIKWLREQGIQVSIVAELKRTLGPIGTDMVSKFLIKQGVIPASKGGKLKTLLQSVALGLYILPLTGWLATARVYVLAAALVVTVVTGLDYVYRAVRLRRGTSGAAQSRS